VIPARLAGPASAPVVDPDLDEATDVDPDRPWDVIVWDDPVNLMTYVVFVLRRIFGYPEPVARRLMLEVHHKGRALVATEPREQAEFYVQQLHGYGLQATMQRAS
jgi:ATP-dependent Clp protease adaptor protein ClpS